MILFILIVPFWLNFTLQTLVVPFKGAMSSFVSSRLFRPSALPECLLLLHLKLLSPAAGSPQSCDGSWLRPQPYCCAAGSGPIRSNLPLHLPGSVSCGHALLISGAGGWLGRTSSCPDPKGTLAGAILKGVRRAANQSPQSPGIHCS